MLSVVKKVRPIKPGDLQSPYPIDMLATAWLLGIANPQSIKRLGHFLTADCKSAGTSNGGRAYPALQKKDMPVSMLQTTERFTRLAATSRLRRERLTIGNQKHPPTLSSDNDVNIVQHSSLSSQTTGKWDIRRN